MLLHMITKIGQKLTLFSCKHPNTPLVPFRSVYVLSMFHCWRKPLLKKNNDGRKYCILIEIKLAQKR